jgi:hypothetical protein
MAEEYPHVPDQVFLLLRHSPTRAEAQKGISGGLRRVDLEHPSAAIRCERGNTGVVAGVHGRHDRRQLTDRHRSLLPWASGQLFPEGLLQDLREPRRHRAAE